MTHADPTPAFLPRRRTALAVLPALVVAGLGLGCYRATGINRGTVTAQQIPEVGGDKVGGLKATAAPGDYYIGNDYLGLVIDGTPFGQGVRAVAGAAGGGSIIDIGQVLLDQNFKRVAVPADALDRLTPVLNQDPDISLVLTQFDPSYNGDMASLSMRGFVHDPLHRLPGATWDAEGRVLGLEVEHSVTLAKPEQHYTVETTLRNTGASTLGIRNIGDYLYQKGAGFRFLVPASEDMNGAALDTWGSEIPASGPGTTFGDPAAAVKASMVAFMGTEPTGQTEDSHVTLGILPLDNDFLAVSSDPQAVLTEVRPKVSSRLVAGSLPVASLAPGGTLTYRRRLYLVSGSSQNGNFPNQATGVLNVMSSDRQALRGQEGGGLVIRPAGSAVKLGPALTEIRIDRQTPSGWRLERVEVIQPYENSPIFGQANDGTLGLSLPVGTFRMKVQNTLFGSESYTELRNSVDLEGPDLPRPIAIEAGKTFYNRGADLIAPERDLVESPSGNITNIVLQTHGFILRGEDKPSNHIQPGRVQFFGTGGTPDPFSKRILSLATSFSPVYKRPVYAGGSNFGVFSFQAGNEAFGASLPARYPLALGLSLGDYEIAGIRGPLSQIETIPFRVSQGTEQFLHEMILLPFGTPDGWTTFDLPGPSNRTGGGHLVTEALSSALAEGIQVVACTEVDTHADALAIGELFRAEFGVSGLTDVMRSSVGGDPMIFNARTAALPAHGTATALATPAPTPARRGGARDMTVLTLADFVHQGQGAYYIAHRPRGPQGLFTLQGFDPAVALGTGANAWWTATGAVSGSRVQGDFDALELLRGEGCDPADPSAWFAEFKQVREDWFGLLRQQTPTAFTKGLGLSSAEFTYDTPVGLARTYLKATGITAAHLDPVLEALRTGAAVASTGPFLDATVASGGSSVGPGGLAAGAASVQLTITVVAPDWVPVDEVRVVVNGTVVQTLNPATFTASTTDARARTTTVTVAMPGGKDGFIVVEAGVPLTQSGAYHAGSYWNRFMKGIYPIALTNPIFVNADGGGYAPPFP